MPVSPCLRPTWFFRKYIVNTRTEVAPGLRQTIAKEVRAEIKKSTGKTPDGDTVDAEVDKRLPKRLDDLIATKYAFNPKIIVATKLSGVGYQPWANGVIAFTMAAATDANKKFKAAQTSHQIVDHYEMDTKKTLIGYKDLTTLDTALKLTFPEIRPDWITGTGKPGEPLTAASGRPLIPMSDFAAKTAGQDPLTQGGVNRKLKYNDHPAIMVAAAQYDFKNLRDVIAMPGVGPDKFVDLMSSATKGKIKPEQVKQFLADVGNMNSDAAVKRTQQFMQDFANAYQGGELVPFATTLAKNGANKGVDGLYGTATAATFQEFSAIVQQVVTTTKEPIYKEETIVKPVFKDKVTQGDVEIPVYLYDGKVDEKYGKLDQGDVETYQKNWGGGGSASGSRAI